MKERLTEAWYDDMEQFDRYAPKSPNIEINCGGDDFQNIIDKLAEYETAEEEGRLVWLPCKIGDVLYLPIDFQNRIYTGKCVGFEYSRMRRKWVVKVFTSEERNSYEAFEHFGKTFFLTREEAEKALEEMKNALEKHITARIKSEEMVD